MRAVSDCCSNGCERNGAIHNFTRDKTAFGYERLDDPSIAEVLADGSRHSDDLAMALWPLWYGWGGLNAWLFLLAQEVRSEAFEPALGFVSAIGAFSSAVYYAGVIGAAAVHVARDRERRIVGCRLSDAWVQTLFSFLLATAMAAAIVWLLKAWLHFPRPWEVFGPRLGAGALLVDSDASFPSGHAAFTAVLVGSVWPTLAGRRVRAVLLLFLVCVGLSRVLIGAHFPADVIGGYAVGFGSVWIARHVVRGFERLVGRRLRPRIGNAKLEGGGRDDSKTA